MIQKVLLNATLCFLVTDTQVLLARKQRNIGKGLWNGYGGGIEVGESVRTAAIRELEEECRVVVAEQDLTYTAVIDFYNYMENGESFNCRIHVFLASHWSGEPRTTHEMSDPTWFSKNAPPFDEMMLADRHWLPRILSGGTWYGKAWYGPNHTTLEQEVFVKPCSVETLDRL